MRIVRARPQPSGRRARIRKPSTSQTGSHDVQIDHITWREYVTPDLEYSREWAYRYVFSTTIIPPSPAHPAGPAVDPLLRGIRDPADECKHERLPGDRDAACGCWGTEADEDVWRRALGYEPRAPSVTTLASRRQRNLASRKKKAADLGRGTGVGVETVRKVARGR